MSKEETFEDAEGSHIRMVHMGLEHRVDSEADRFYVNTPFLFLTMSHEDLYEPLDFSFVSFGLSGLNIVLV